jgi:hypothetical protein
MQPSKTVVVATVLSLSIGYGLGRFQENARMDTFCGILLKATHAGNTVDLLKLHESALESIRSGDLGKAEKVLLMLARGDAETIVACKKEAECSHWSGFEGNRPPDEALIQRALAAK